MVVTKTNWLGGINQLSDITKLSDNEYWILINARVRKNVVEAVQLPLNVTNNLSEVGNIQDISAAGSLLVAFAGGKAFYKTTDGTWLLIESFYSKPSLYCAYSSFDCKLYACSYFIDRNSYARWGCRCFS